LLNMAKALSLKAVALPDVTDAVDAVINSKEAVCITGSVALAGAARAVWARRSRIFVPESDED
jgi:hypothetical protein